MKTRRKRETIMVCGERVSKTELAEYAPNHTLPEILQHFKIRKTDRTDTLRARLTRLGISYKKIDRTRLMQDLAKNKRDTLCWDCARACNDALGCPWVRFFKPVPGWKIKQTYTKTTGCCANTSVIECPLFVEEAKR